MREQKAEILDIFWESDMKSKEWDGSGLPPDGTVCEYHCAERDEWRECEIVAYYFANVVAVDLLDSSAVCLRIGLFRSIKTPKQIAKEKRENVIADMYETVMMGDSIRYGVEALYDAGYRKTEVKK